MVRKLVMAVVAGAMVAGAGDSCFAVLGETEAELLKRYGKPVAEVRPDHPLAEGDKEFLFQKDGVGVHVYLWRGRSANEEYLFPKGGDKFALVSDEPEKVAAILKANAQGSSFKSDPKPLEIFVRAWECVDAKATAHVTKASPDILVLQTDAFVEESAMRVKDALRRK